MIRKITIIFYVIIFSLSCNGDRNNSDSEGFRWKETVSLRDIPEIPVKGYMNGREVSFAYINYEKWRGSNDNVINFSVIKPLQNCGYIEGFRGFSLVRKGGDFTQGEWLKSDFNMKLTEEAYYIDNGTRSEPEWNCAMKIDEITSKHVRGSIVIFFNDASKSWLAGRFEAIVCNN